MATNTTIKKKNIYKYWFRKNVGEILVIVSEEATNKKSEDAITTSENYSYTDNVGDKDTLIETVILLARFYPNAKIKRLFPREFNEREDGDKNLVVIGGPINNAVCKRLMDKMNSNIRYSTVNWKMTVFNNEFDSNYSEKEGMKKDYGYFASFTNPRNKNSQIILINGLNTFGVLGAFKAFSDLDEADENFLLLNSFVGSEKVNFESYFPVNVFNCELNDCTKVVVDCPSKETITILNIDKKKRDFIPAITADSNFIKNSSNVNELL